MIYQRDFSNTLHWTQSMKFLKNHGFVQTKTGHGTTVVEEYGNLGGLERAFHEVVCLKLKNFISPLYNLVSIGKFFLPKIIESSFG